MRRVKGFSLLAAVVLAAALPALAGCDTTGTVSSAVETVGVPVSPANAAAPVDFPQLTCAAYRMPERSVVTPTVSRMRAGDPYYMEFRERDARYIGSGHTFVVFGALDKQGRPLTRQYIGLFPLGGPAGFAVGAAVPVPAQLTPEPGDCNIKPAVVYRVSLTKAQYQALAAKVREKLAHPPLWSMVVYNCNQFAAELGEVAGLKTPFSIMVPANAFLHAYIRANEGDAASQGA